MKKISYIIAVLLCCWQWIFAQQSEYFYYYNGEKIYIETDTESVIAYIDSKNVSVSDLRNNFRIVKFFNSGDNDVLCCKIAIPSELNSENYIKYLKRLDYITDLEPVVNDTTDIFATNRIFVKLKSNLDVSILESIATATNAEIEGAIPHCTGWYSLKVNKNSIGNIIEVANFFYETQLFAKVDPDFALDYKILYNASQCVTDEKFGEQWGLDMIDACSAWKITKGDTSIKVAIIDGGIDTSHCEFSSLNTYFSYDIVSDTFPAKVYLIPKHRKDTPSNYYEEPDMFHGITVGGIIFADHNNNKIAGIAPNVSAIDISYNFLSSPLHNLKLSQAINLAVEKGAHVINNSWGLYHGDSGIHSIIIEDAIDNAVEKNRIVVFATGNDCLNVIRYPCNYSEKTFAVGAAYVFDDSIYEVCYFSNKGEELDVLAPGFSILTTHNNNGYFNFTGTSAAAPHVAGVAALMLSVNPFLTIDEVMEIISRTAQKDLSWVTDSDTFIENREFGQWTYYYGYGLVNAHRSVLKAAYNKIYGDTIITTCNTRQYTITDSINSDIDSVSFFWTCSDNLRIISDCNSDSVIVKATGIGKGQLYCNIIHDNDTVTTQLGLHIVSNLAYLDNISLNENVAFADTILLSGIISIDSNAKINFTNNVIYCAPSALITVMPGASLTFDSVLLTSACPGEMWQGIDVVGNSLAHQTIETQGSLTLNNGTIIENAICAIFIGLRNDSVSQTTGGIISGNNSTFKNNLCALKVNSYSDISLYGFIKNYDCSFSKCVFSIDNNNYFSSNSLTFSQHIKLFDVKGIVFKGCTFESIVKGRAIFTEDAGFTVNEYCSQEALNSLTCSCPDQYSQRSLFSGFTTAIENYTTGTQYPIKIDFTDFNNNTTAIRINGNNFASVTRCSFNLSTSPMFMLDISGLYLNNCSGFKIEENTFSGAILSGFCSSIGIIVNNSGNSNNTIYRNNFSDMNIGVRINGNNGNSSSGLQVACSNFNNVVNNISLASNATAKSSENISINNCISTLSSPPKSIKFISSTQTSSTIDPFTTYSETIRELMADSLQNLVEIEQMHRDNIADKYSLTETRFQMGEIENENIENFDDATNYSTLQELKHTLFLLQNADNHIKWSSLNDIQIEELRTIANNNGRAAVIAQGILCFFYEICPEYDEEFDLIAFKNAKSPAVFNYNSSVIVFPNPTKDELKISLTDGEIIKSITLYDIENRSLASFGSQNLIKLEKFAKGIYLLKVTDTKNNIYWKRIIKN